MYAEEIAVIESYGPEIDLSSPCLNDVEYQTLKAKISANEST